MWSSDSGYNERCIENVSIGYDKYSLALVRLLLSISRAKVKDKKGKVIPAAGGL
jgi:hypothetical protein